jgi:putative transposase
MERLNGVSGNRSREVAMRVSFKYRLSPNTTTEKKLFFVLNRCRELYNAGLQERKDAYRMAGVSRSYYDQAMQLTSIKHDLRPEYQEIGAHVLQDVLRRLDKAFKAFFRRIQNGEEPGYPRFQGRGRYTSFTYPDRAGWKLDGNHLTLTKIGCIRVKLYRPIEGKIKTATIKYEAGQWYVVFSCEVPEPEQLPLSSEDVGIDLGVTHLATLSNGEMIEHPRYLRRAKKVLEKRQQALSGKKRGSHRRDKARKLVAKAHRKVRNQRRDFLHKQSRKLVNRYQVIVFEDIQTSNLTKKPKPKKDEGTGHHLPNGASAKAGLNTSILDAGWGTFVEMCSVKAACAGRTLIKVDPRYTSALCSGCGQVRKKDLSERWHSCDCGAELDRDVNAAINILERGRKGLTQASAGTFRRGTA